MVQHRFLFLPPSAREMAFFKRWRWANYFSWLWVIALVEFIDSPKNPLPPYLGVLIPLSIALFVIGRYLDDIERRDKQARFGFVEITPDELRICRAFKEESRHQWHNYRGYELGKRVLRLQFLQQPSLPLRELENPDALLDALRAQTASAR